MRSACDETAATPPPVSRPSVCLTSRFLPVPGDSIAPLCPVAPAPLLDRPVATPHLPHAAPVSSPGPGFLLHRSCPEWLTRSGFSSGSHVWLVISHDEAPTSVDRLLGMLCVLFLN